MPGSPIQNNMFNKNEGYVQQRNPFPVSSCGRRRNDGSPLKASNEPRKTTKGKGRNFRTVEEGAGMTAKGVASYKAKNPGRKSFCARSKGWTGERGKAARRRWKC